MSIVAVEPVVGAYPEVARSILTQHSHGVRRKRGCVRHGEPSNAHAIEPPEPPKLTDTIGVFTVMLRNAMFHRVELFGDEQDARLEALEASAPAETGTPPWLMWGGAAVAAGVALLAVLRLRRRPGAA